MFVYDPTMSDQIADDISSLITSSNKDISGVMLIVSSSKVQGIVNTCSLSNELSALELSNLRTYISRLSHEQSVSNKLFIYGSIKYNFLNSLIKLLSLDYLNISAVLSGNGIIIGIHPNDELVALYRAYN